MAWKSTEWFKQGAQVWQMTDHATEKWVTIGEIACAKSNQRNKNIKKQEKSDNDDETAIDHR